MRASLSDLSMISYTKLNMKEESSDSNCNIYISNAFKRSRVERFKGVVPQQNGHWGAQIYANHQRVWLGTFKSEIDAAMAYDSAAIKLRSGDCHRNFPWTNISIQEQKFQSYFTTDVVLSMIRDGSYPSKYADFLRSQQGELGIGLNLSSIHGDGDFSCTLLFQKELTPSENLSSIHGDGDYSCTLLFQKELTPSDVGKLNRLVIPKKFAVKHFPHVPDQNLNGEERVDEVQLEFYDRQMILWKFRYCYWKSSQSFVFTRGWNRFVKEKGLRANDTIAFYMYESRDKRHIGQSFLVIDVATKMEMNFGGNDNPESAKEEELGDQNDTKGFKLFGVQID